jgi:hypothetical protein
MLGVGAALQENPSSVQAQKTRSTIHIGANAIELRTFTRETFTASNKFNYAETAKSHL